MAAATATFERYLDHPVFEGWQLPPDVRKRIASQLITSETPFLALWAASKNRSWLDNKYPDLTTLYEKARAHAAETGNRTAGERAWRHTALWNEVAELLLELDGSVANASMERSLELSSDSLGQLDIGTTDPCRAARPSHQMGRSQHRRSAWRARYILDSEELKETSPSMICNWH
eukprot:4621252-Prymnesium_polylepis.1